MGIKHIRSSGYQPQGNAVERFHSFLNAALTIQCHEQRIPWDEALAPIIYAYRASVSRSTGFSPFYMVYARQAPLSMDLVLAGPEQAQSPLQFVKALENRMAIVYKQAIQQQTRVRNQNVLYRNAEEKRKAVNFEVGDAVKLWGPVSAGALQG